VNNNQIATTEGIFMRHVFKSMQNLMTVAGLAFATAATAQQMNGSLGFVEYPIGSVSSTWTSSTLQLNSADLVNGSETGIFASLVPVRSDVAGVATALTGLSTAPTTENINDFFQFSSPDSVFGTLGTTPNNRFDFYLATITDVGNDTFTGTGTLVDNTGAYASTPASITLNFSSPAGAPLNEGEYSFTLSAEPIPEPVTINLLLTGLIGSWALRRHKA
jgi:hypothetical protein